MRRKKIRPVEDSFKRRREHDEEIKEQHRVANLKRAREDAQKEYEEYKSILDAYNNRMKHANEEMENAKPNTPSEESKPADEKSSTGSKSTNASESKPAEQKKKKDANVKQEEKEEPGFFDKVGNWFKGLFEDNDKLEKPDTETKKTESRVKPKNVNAPVTTSDLIDFQEDQEDNIEYNITKEYNDQISKLYDQYDSLYKKLKQSEASQMMMWQPYMGQITPSITNTQLNKSSLEVGSLQRQVDDIQRKIQSTIVERDRFKQLHHRYNTRSGIAEGILSETVQKSDAFVRAQAGVDDAEKRVKDHNADILFSIGDIPLLTVGNGNVTKEFTKDLKNYESLRRIQAEKNAEYDKVIDYLHKKIMSGSRIPTSVDQFPRHLQVAAKDAFTINGQFVLNEDYERNLRANLWKTGDEINQTAKALDKFQKEQPLFEDQPLEQELQRTNWQILANEELEGDEEYNRSDLFAKKRLLQEARENIKIFNDITNIGKKRIASIEDIKSAKATKNPMNVLKGIGNKVINFNTWTMSAPDWATYSTIEETVDKYAKGEKLTNTEKELLLTKELADVYNSVYNPSRVSSMYRWGQITGESLSFMATFMATQGVGRAMR